MKFEEFNYMLAIGNAIWILYPNPNKYGNQFSFDQIQEIDEYSMIPII